MGATLAMLFRQPASAADRDHRVRLGWGVPAPPFAAEFEARFGFPLVEVYGLSDAGIPLYNRPGEPAPAGSCGKAVPPFDVRIHDAEGRELPDGQVGEIVVSSAEPFLVTTGYFGDPAATAAAFRDGWLRTGDLARRDRDGFFHFVGRLKDIIRRRGENISAFEVEQALLSHPDIVEAAAYGVPSELTEEDVMATAVPRAGAAVDPRALRDWAARRLARHMVPRYLRIAERIPRTPTEKVAKHLLVAQGVTPGTVDFDPPRFPPES
jgi:carnitine-CoA ligase